MVLRCVLELCLVLVPPRKTRKIGHCLFYGVESLSGVLERGVLEWSQILELQK